MSVEFEPELDTFGVDSEGVCDARLDCVVALAGTNPWFFVQVVDLDLYALTSSLNDMALRSVSKVCWEGV